MYRTGYPKEIYGQYDIYRNRDASPSTTVTGKKDMGLWLFAMESVGYL